MIILEIAFDYFLIKELGTIDFFVKFHLNESIRFLNLDIYATKNVTLSNIYIVHHFPRACVYNSELWNLRILLSNIIVHQLSRTRLTNGITLLYHKLVVGFDQLFSAYSISQAFDMIFPIQTLKDTIYFAIHICSKF